MILQRKNGIIKAFKGRGGCQMRPGHSGGCGEKIKKVAAGGVLKDEWDERAG